MERRYTFGNDFPGSRMMDIDDDSMMNDDLNRLRDRFHDRARSYRMQPDPEFDRWFEPGNDTFNQPPFKIPKEDERSSYVRNIPIFQENQSNRNNTSSQNTSNSSNHSGSDENLIHQSKSAIPRPVPPGGHKSTSPTPPTAGSQFTPSTAPPPATQPKPRIPVKVTPSNGSDSGIERAASGSPNSDNSVPPRTFGFAADRQQRANSVGRGGLWENRENERKIPVRVESVPPPKNEAIPMGYTKVRDPKEPIPMGFEQRSASAPGEKDSTTQAPKVDRKSDIPKAARPTGTASDIGGSAQAGASVHRVPIVVKNSELPRSASAPPKPTETSPPPPVLVTPVVKPRTPLEKIEDVMCGVRDLEARINAFQGARTEHEFKLLDELLTQAVIKLDSVQADGVDEVRNARKVAVKRVHDLSSSLEAKATADRPKSKSPSAGGKGASPGPAGGGSTTRILIPMHPNGKSDAGDDGAKRQN